MKRQARADLTGFDAWLAAGPDVLPAPRHPLHALPVADQGLLAGKAA
jgi:hypothetical protein